MAAQDWRDLFCSRTQAEGRLSAVVIHSDLSPERQRRRERADRKYMGK
jgi:hypothetical protein